jgi:integrase
MSVTWEGLRLQTSIGVSVLSSQFDFVKGKIKSIAEHAMENNYYMENISQQIKNYYFSNKANDHYITKVQMKVFIDRILKKNLQYENEFKSNVEEKEYSFFELFDLFISARQNNPKNNQRLILSYCATKKHLLVFSKTTGFEIDIARINNDFADRLVLFLAHEKKHVNSTIDRNLRTLKVFLNWAYENDYLKDLKWKRVMSDVTKDFKLKTDSDRIVLNNEEISMFETYEPETEKLKQIKDLFLIHIYTGLRVSDLMSLKPE